MDIVVMKLEKKNKADKGVKDKENNVHHLFWKFRIRRDSLCQVRWYKEITPNVYTIYNF